MREIISIRNRNKDPLMGFKWGIAGPYDQGGQKRGRLPMAFFAAGKGIGAVDAVRL